MTPVVSWTLTVKITCLDHSDRRNQRFSRGTKVQNTTWLSRTVLLLVAVNSRHDTAAPLLTLDVQARIPTFAGLTPVRVPLVAVKTSYLALHNIAALLDYVTVWSTTVCPSTGDLFPSEDLDTVAVIVVTL